MLTCEKPDLAQHQPLFRDDTEVHRFRFVIRPRMVPACLASTLPTPAAMLKVYYLYWRCRRLAPQYDIAITADNEADMGLSCGIQYVHFPRFHPHRPAVDLKWYHRIPDAATGILRIPARVRRFLRAADAAQRDAGKFRLYRPPFHEVHDTQTITLYPPAIGEFLEIPWEQREKGFLIIGRISPEKRIESRSTF